MPKPKMKSTAADRVQHYVIIEVDGVQEEVLVAAGGFDAADDCTADASSVDVQPRRCRRGPA